MEIPEVERKYLSGNIRGSLLFSFIFTLRASGRLPSVRHSGFSHSDLLQTLKNAADGSHPLVQDSVISFLSSSGFTEESGHSAAPAGKP